MAIAKIITDGNTQMIILPEGFRFDCDEVEVSRSDSCVRITPAPKSVMSKELIDILTGFTDDVADTIEDAKKNFTQSEREQLSRHTK